MDIVSINIETLIKIVGALIAVLVFLNTLYENRFKSSARYREEYNFAKIFFSDLEKNNMHPYLEEKGYQAVARTDTVSGYEVAYILSLDEPNACLRYFIYSKRLFNDMYKGDLKLSFKSKYSSNWSRAWRRNLYLAFYFIFAMTVFVPFIIYDRIDLVGADMAAFFFVCIFFGGYFGWINMAGYVRFSFAEKLIASQVPHTSVVVENSNVGGVGRV